MPKSAENQGLTTSKAEGDSTLNEHNKMPCADSANIINVTCSDKLSNKPEPDCDLALVVKAWPELPKAIRSAIVCSYCQKL
jgi:hypothetical protein